MPTPQAPENPERTPQETPRPRPWGGVGVGVALVVLAIVIGVTAQGQGGPEAVAATVPATGHTTTVAVVAEGMRYHPDHITVPAGDRLVIELTNRDNRRHDLVLATGARTDSIGQDATVQLDAGVVGGAQPRGEPGPVHRQRHGAAARAAEARALGRLLRARAAAPGPQGPEGVKGLQHQHPHSTSWPRRRPPTTRLRVGALRATG